MMAKSTLAVIMVDRDRTGRGLCSAGHAVDRGINALRASVTATTMDVAETVRRRRQNTAYGCPRLEAAGKSTCETSGTSLGWMLLECH